MTARSLCPALIAAAAALLCSSALRSEEIAIGKKGPDFKVKGIDDKEYTLESFKDADVLILAFTCNECPVAQAYEERFIEFAKTYKDKKVAFLAINCNNESESLEAMKKHAKEKGFNFTYAFDASGASAHAYGARVTPHIFVLDRERKVAYRGAFDDSQSKPKTSYLTNAVDALLKGKKPEETSTKAFGCGIRAKLKNGA